LAMGAGVHGHDCVAPWEWRAGGVSVYRDGVDTRLRVALYVDGFNLYHAIENLKQPHLKWLNLWALGSRLCPPRTHRLVRAYYVTAKKNGESEKNERHQQYLNALRTVGVDYELGNFINDEVECRACTHRWNAPREKESDINLALAVVHDAYAQIFDVAYLVTADSDQAATARYLKANFPEKELVSIVPPGMEYSKAIKTYASVVHLNEGVIAQCLFPEKLMRQVDGETITVATRPKTYDPPKGWTPAKQQQVAAARRAPGTRSKVARGVV
jgi:hypothetical protein